MQLHLTMKSKKRPCSALSQGAEGDTTIASEGIFYSYPTLSQGRLT